MVARDSWIISLEVVGVLGLLAVAYVVGATALWLAWALVTAVVSGIALVRLNWGFDPPPVS